MENGVYNRLYRRENASRLCTICEWSARGGVHYIPVQVNLPRPLASYVSQYLAAICQQLLSTPQFWHNSFILRRERRNGDYGPSDRVAILESTCISRLSYDFALFSIAHDYYIDYRYDLYLTIFDFQKFSSKFWFSMIF